MSGGLKEDTTLSLRDAPSPVPSRRSPSPPWSDDDARDANVVHTAGDAKGAPQDMDRKWKREDSPTLSQCTHVSESPDAEGHLEPVRLKLIERGFNEEEVRNHMSERALYAQLIKTADSRTQKTFHA